MGSAYALAFEVSPQDLKRLKAAPELRRQNGKSADEKYLVSIYFDTAAGGLASRDAWLRVRHVGDERVQTIRSEAADAASGCHALLRRLDDDIPDLEDLRDNPLGAELTKGLKGKLRPVFQTRVHRTRSSDRINTSHIDVTFDEGQFRSGPKIAPISQVKLELKQGRPADVVRLARRIGGLVPANWTVRSKGRRGYDFIAGATAVVQPRKIQLQRGMNAAEAFRVIARSILRDLAANRPAVSDLAPEGVHRMRIDLRRLRAALSVFSELLGDNQTRRLNAELQWLAGKLGAARDLDVMAATIERLRRGKSDQAELRDFAGELAMQRASAFEDARLAVQSRRYRTLLLDALQWIEAGTWATHARSDIGHCRIKTLAENILTRRAKKVIGMAGEFEQLDAGQRHKLRIAVKKLRYSADFFESLFPGGKAKLRYAAFIDDLKKLQDSLGALNDIVVHGALVSEISSGDPRAARRTRDVASGILSERERRISGRLLKAAGKAAAELADAKPFW